MLRLRIIRLPPPDAPPAPPAAAFAASSCALAKATKVVTCASTESLFSSNDGRSTSSVSNMSKAFSILKKLRIVLISGIDDIFSIILSITGEKFSEFPNVG